MPIELDDLVVTMLDREPPRRPHTVDEVANALAACGTPWVGSWPIDRPTTQPLAPSDPTEPSAVTDQPATVAD